MKFASIRDLRMKPAQVWKTLKSDDDVVLTSNGRPFAIITRADDESVEATLATLRKARAQAALREIHTAAVREGLHSMTKGQIDAEIRAYRAAHDAPKTTSMPKKPRRGGRR